ncbi:MAG: hypothetical protein ROY99_05210 [Ignavibacterium sp.]|jgi:gas vesicle protein|nr:hypothetical protein [Ignavibacterium sp.]
MKEKCLHFMDFSQIELQETEQIDELIELNAIKFRKLKHQYLKGYLKKNETYLDYLKTGSRHFVFQLPDEINEIFIPKENSSFFWLLESPTLLACEKYFNENSNSRNSDSLELKKNFTKWAINSDPNQKRIFASITLKSFKDFYNSPTFIDLIYYALVLNFEDSIRDHQKSINYLVKAQEQLNETSIEPAVKKEIEYLILLYKAFAHIALANFEEAAEELNYAIDIKTNGINAKFYFAYVSALQKRDDFTKGLLKDILDYDIKRINYAIESSSIILLNYFMTNPVFPNIGEYIEFSTLSDYILKDLIESSIDSNNLIRTIVPRLNNLKKLDYDEYYSDEARSAIKFLYDVCENYSQDNSFYTNMISGSINNKLHGLLDSVTENIKEKLYENYYRIMSLFENTIAESEKLIEQYSKEVGEIKSGLLKRLATSIEQIEDYVKDALWEIEERKKNLNFQPKYDPAVTFRNSMSYNVLVSIIVFIIGGIAGYFNSSDYFENDFYLMLGRIILTGVKWSSLTFVIGFFISGFISGLVIFDKSNEKQRLEKRTLELQKQKEISIDILKKEAEQKQKALSEGYLERIESHKNKIEETKKEKANQEVVLKTEADEKLQPYIEKLKPLYNK